jgi:LL-diaminopimelate aminotransferase
MPLLEENDFKPGLSGIDAKGVKLMHLNYPNNPTAATVDKGFLKEAVDFALDNNIILCHDAPYSEVTFDGYRAPSILEVDGAMECCIEFHSLSKTYNMTGWRIGMAVGNSEVLAGLGKIKENLDSGVFNAVQMAGVEALTGPQGEVRKNNAILQERRDIMVEGLRDMGWDVKKPKATFYLWIRVPDKSSSINFCSKVLDKTGVVFTPGVGFGTHGEGYFRVALTQSKERLQEALNRLKTNLN